jgi:competence protein CoiA
MPLYAFDDQNHIIFAPHAEPYRHYHCIECQTPVFKRTGRERQAHFYHKKSIKSCRLYSQSIDHLVMQTQLYGLNPALIIERPFERILRIADLCWEDKKIVFEIQCSPIEPYHVEKRMRDYAEEGYAVIWLLDDRLYNKKKMRISEPLVRSHGSYYFSLAKGLVYDQFEVIHENERIARGPHLPIDMLKPLKARHFPKLRMFNERKSQNYFAGDLLDKTIRYPKYIERLQEYETQVVSRYQKTKTLAYQLKKCFYIAWEWVIRHYYHD